MEKKSGYFFLLLGSSLFSHILLANSVDYFTCPNAQQFDYAGPQRTGQNAIKFEFVGQYNPGWTSIQLDLAASVPIGSPRIPVLEVMGPIELYQKDGNYVLLCRYKGGGEYGPTTNIPNSTLTILSSSVKECYKQNDTTIACTRSLPL